jgi:hypothetical protein
VLAHGWLADTATKALDGVDAVVHRAAVVAIEAAFWLPTGTPLYPAPPQHLGIWVNGRTTSANSAVTCLYSADWVACVTGAPHSLQNLEFGGSSVPHDHTVVAQLSAHRDYCHPRQYRVTAGQRCPPYRRATSDTNF